jgi:two-component system, chemotaxis family, protein-glutamate methylesterase/glutaminase
MAVRVLVVEDSPTVRHRLCEVIAADPELALVGEVGDGQRAIEACRDLRPDVIAMDMVLPVLDGLAATEHIMAHHPTPILIVSASLNRGAMFCTYDALAAGAVDVLDKPRADELDDEWDRRFVAALKLVARIRVITHPRARLSGRSRTPHAGPPPGSSPAAPAAFASPARTGSSPLDRLAAEPETCSIVAIGASTGGPGAVAQILRALPPRFQLPILLVMHIGEPFAPALADWLDRQSSRRVYHPGDGDPVAGAFGRVAMAPPGSHLLVRGGRLRLSDAPERNWCRPSVDVLFEAVAAEYGARAAGCLLTGMGRDGAAGLLAIRTAGGVTMSQDEASCTVFGMPREAELLGASQRVLPLGELAGAIAALEPRPR